HPVALPRIFRRRGLRRRRCIFRLRGLAIDDVVELDDGGRRLVVRTNFVADLDEYQRAGAAGLFGDVGDRRYARDAVANAWRSAEFELTARPHPAWKRNRRKKSTAFRMAVRSDFGLPIERQKIEPVPQRRQRRADGRAFGGAIERRRKR